MNERDDSSGAPAERPAPGEPGMARLHLPTMSCEHCKQRILQALTDTPGVDGADFDIPGKEVTVRFNPEMTNPRKIAESIQEKSGYEANMSS